MIACACVVPLDVVLLLVLLLAAEEELCELEEGATEDALEGLLELILDVAELVGVDETGADELGTLEGVLDTASLLAGVELVGVEELTGVDGVETEDDVG